jgi:hypothetical protein
VDKEIGERLGVVAQALNPGGDGLIILTRLFLGGTQALAMQHHLKGADDLRGVRLQAIKRSAERLPKRPAAGKTTPSRAAALAPLARGLGGTTACAPGILRIP